MRISAADMKAGLERVKRLKSSAQSDREFGDYQEALNNLEEALAWLEPTLQELEGAPPNEPGDHGVWREQVARELADCYGMHGGNFARLDMLLAAEAAYERGSRIEHEYRIPDTYNRTNAIVLRLLRDPSQHPSLGDMIGSTWEVVQRHVQGRSRDKWWSWADFGLLSLLSVNLPRVAYGTDFREEARNAYRQFVSLGPGPHNIETTRDRLRQLEERFEGVDGTTAASIREQVEVLDRSL
jgi:tetratricopeptide (TPR) repeat protein